jgi:hypothetical protein
MEQLIKGLQNNWKHLYPSRNSVYSSRYKFLNMLNQERQRCEASHKPLTSLIIQFRDQHNISKKDKHAFMKKIIRQIERNTRQCDIKCLMTDSQIDILLINTSLIYGQLVQDRLRQVFLASFKKKKSKFQWMIRELEYQLSPIVFAFEAQDEELTAARFYQENEFSNIIAIND